MAQVFGYPFERLPRMSRRTAAIASIAARWISAHRSAGSGDGALAAVLGGPVRARVVDGGVAPVSGGARAVVRIGGASIDVRAPAELARWVAQRLVGGPSELAAPRSLDAVEEALWAMAVAAALEDLGVAGEVWPVVDGDPPAPADGDPLVVQLTIGAARPSIATGVVPRGASEAAPGPAPGHGPGHASTRVRRESRPDADGAGPGFTASVVVTLPRELALRVPATAGVAAWAAETMLALPVVVGRCALPRTAVEGLRVRDVVVVERPAGGGAELAIGAGAIGLSAAPGAVEAAVATGYGVRDMALPDDAHVELTVALGTSELSLRALTELAIGQVVSLGRPLAGPFELRVEGRVIGRGGFVDVEGELGVRVVRLGKE